MSDFKYKVNKNESTRTEMRTACFDKEFLKGIEGNVEVVFKKNTTNLSYSKEIKKVIPRVSKTDCVKAPALRW